MYQVKTDHQIVAFGENLMRLFDRDGTELVTATRTDDEWTIHAEGLDDTTATSRAEAVTAMTEHALAAHPREGGQGYSTFVPSGLLDMP